MKERPMPRSARALRELCASSARALRELCARSGDGWRQMTHVTAAGSRALRPPRSRQGGPRHRGAPSGRWRARAIGLGAFSRAAGARAARPCLTRHFRRGSPGRAWACCGDLAPARGRTAETACAPDRRPASRQSRRWSYRVLPPTQHRTRPGSAGRRRSAKRGSGRPPLGRPLDPPPRRWSVPNRAPCSAAVAAAPARPALARPDAAYPAVLAASAASTVEAAWMAHVDCAAARAATSAVSAAARAVRPVRCPHGLCKRRRRCETRRRPGRSKWASG